jgi:ring-1,2-phenylacetyl-CoA epoxidase subunit PaaC
MEASEQHIQYIIRLADDALIQGQRLSEWCGHGPILEEDIALANLALDHIGQARALYTHAAKLEGKGRTEDDLAYFRDEVEFRNHLILELPIGDFGFTIMRQLLYSVFALERMKSLASQEVDTNLAAIASKAIKELRYHAEHAKDWVIRLGDGTEESHKRMQGSLDKLWPYTGEMFVPVADDLWSTETGLCSPLNSIKAAWADSLAQTFHEATLTMPALDGWMHQGGKSGNHTEHLGYLLAEMQSLARKHPGVTW